MTTLGLITLGLIPLAAIAGISGLISLGSSLYGGYKAGQERKKQRAELSRLEADNKSWYNTNALGDYTQRADVQALIRNMRENLYKQNKAAANTAVITGATPEAQAARKEASNKAMADVYSNIGVLGQQYKDRITDRYLANKAGYAGQRMGIADANALSYENLAANGIQGVGNSAINLAGSLNNQKKQ